MEFYPLENGESDRAEEFVDRNSEYEKIAKFFRDNNFELTSLKRIKNRLRNVRFLIRQQHLVALNPSKVFYEMKRFVPIRHNVSEAIDMNLDCRRCEGVPTNFSRKPKYAPAVIVVSVTTSNPYDDFTPSRDSDFDIEYVAYLS